MKRPTVVVHADRGKPTRVQYAATARFPGGFLARSLHLLLFAIISLPVHSVGQVPPDEDWRTLATEHFRVTFPAPLEMLARRAGARAERAWGDLSGGFPERDDERIDIVLTDHVDQSNGIASVAPRPRIVIYARPPVDGSVLTYYDDWLELVITHELAHIFHLDASGPLGRFLRRVFGRVPGTWPFFPQLGTPGWMGEGLAVHYETALTNSGRGEGTYHAMVLRTAALEGAIEGIDVASGASPVWPAGQRSYVYGATFLDWLLARHGGEALGELIEAIGQQLIPYRLDAAARQALGVSFSTEWKLWRDAVEGEAGALSTALAERAPVTETESVTKVGYTARSPAVSPNGTQLAFARADGLTDPQIRLSAPDGSASRALARTNQASHFTWLPDGSLVFAQPEQAGPYRLRNDLYRVDPAGEVTRLTTGSRLDHPAAAPDGGSVFAIRNDGGTTELVRVDLGSGSVSSLVAADPDVHWAFPVPSPDGRWLAAARWRRGRSFDLVLLDAVSGRILHEVTDDRAVDLSPTWSPDGRWLLWTSDRSGITNVLAVPIDASGRPGPPRQVTNVLTGVAHPSVDPSGSWIYLAAYHAKGWDVERILFDPERWTELFPTAPHYAPVSPESPPPPAEGPVQPYHAATTLTPGYWEPLIGSAVGIWLPGRGNVDLLGPSFGFATSARDVVGRHSLALDARFSTTGARMTGSFSYVYAGLGNPLLSFRLGQSWDGSGPLFGRRAPPVVDTLFMRERERGATVTTTLLLRCCRVFGAISAGAGLVEEDAEIIDRDLYVTSAYSLATPSSRLGDLSVKAALSSVRDHSLSISEEDGASVVLHGRIRSELAVADSLKGVPGEERSYRQLISQARFYQPLRGLGLGRHVLAVKGSIGAASGPGADRFHFRVGGAGGAPESVTGLGLFGGSSFLFPVRGYQNGERAGRVAWSATVEYRFPIARVNRGLGLFPIHLEEVSGDLFADAGNAWGPEFGEAGPRFHNPARSGMASVGAELTANLLALFSSDLPIRFGVALPLVDYDGRGTSPLFYLRLGSSF
jgi:hypothetical protein